MRTDGKHAVNLRLLPEREGTVRELSDIARLHQQALRIAQRDAEQDRIEIRRIWEYLRDSAKRFSAKHYRNGGSSPPANN